MLHKLIYYFFRYPIFKLKLGSIGAGTKLLQPTITGGKRIFIGKSVYIRKNTWLAADPVTGDTNCKLVIGDGTYIGNNCHIYASSLIEIGKKVLIADKVYLSDNIHSYENINIPVIDQPVKQTNPVILKDGCWLGENVCVIGAVIGKNSVVGANSVVTKDVPDFCVVVGSPAKIIKRFNPSSGNWEKTNAKGEFIA
ncbi:MAG TPA: acyltransferase [Chitinophagaceae bacterium]|nr:acyltransferase [Chitinophagaceae bacterium]